MAGTPDQLLDEIRRSVRIMAGKDDGPMAAHVLAEAFAELDQLLTSGGPLPTEWAGSPAQRAVEDVPLPGEGYVGKRRLEAS